MSKYLSHPSQLEWIITRREFLNASGRIVSGFTAGLMTGGLLAASGCDKGPPSLFRFGMVTDLHYADYPNRGTRFYNQSLSKLKECTDLMNREKVDFLIELGDFKDQSNPPLEEKTLEYLGSIETTFQSFTGKRYHVLGNHDVDSISKNQFLESTSNTDIAGDRTYFSFDLKGLHFIVLDANFNADGTDYEKGNFDWTDANIPPEELKWLQSDLGSNDKPVVVFIHQLLDGEGEHYVNNAKVVRTLFNRQQHVLAVFQGHKHSGQYNYLNGVHYYTLKALVEGSGPVNSSYAIVDILPDQGLVVTGFRRAVSQDMANRKGS